MRVARNPHAVLVTVLSITSSWPFSCYRTFSRPFSLSLLPLCLPPLSVWVATEPSVGLGRRRGPQATTILENPSPATGPIPDRLGLTIQSAPPSRRHPALPAARLVRPLASVACQRSRINRSSPHQHHCRCGHSNHFLRQYKLCSHRRRTSPGPSDGLASSPHSSCPVPAGI